ncbi:hypothetical protein RB195_000291 [Necator americanus]|uniref:Uncharacterized protein n=1 Tax=Necator americanus TaxID=51031 RepID=A0ABR1DA32_NECAM
MSVSDFLIASVKLARIAGTSSIFVTRQSIKIPIRQTLTPMSRSPAQITGWRYLLRLRRFAPQILLPPSSDYSTPTKS